MLGAFVVEESKFVILLEVVVDVVDGVSVVDATLVGDVLLEVGNEVAMVVVIVSVDIVDGVGVVADGDGVVLAEEEEYEVVGVVVIVASSVANEVVVTYRDVVAILVAGSIGVVTGVAVGAEGKYLVIVVVGFDVVVGTVLVVAPTMVNIFVVEVKEVIALGADVDVVVEGKVVKKVGE